MMKPVFWVIAIGVVISAANFWYTLAGPSTLVAPHTTLTDYLANNGAGDVRSASAESIQQWLQSHGEIAVAVKHKCSALIADASFGDTADGRICRAAYSTEVYRQRVPDGKTYGAGWK